MRSLSGSGHRGESGASRIGCLLALLLLGLAIYAAVIVVGSEFDYRSVETEMRRQATLAVQASDGEIRSALEARIRQRDIEARPEALTIRRLPGSRITLSFQYTDTLTFLGRWDWIRPRRIRVTESY